MIFTQLDSPFPVWGGDNAGCLLSAVHEFLLAGGLSSAVDTQTHVPVQQVPVICV